MPSGNKDICKSLLQGYSQYQIHQLHSYMLCCGYFGENRILLDNTIVLISVFVILLNPLSDGIWNRELAVPQFKSFTNLIRAL